MNKTTGTILLILLISLAIFNLEPFTIPEAQAYIAYHDEVMVKSYETSDTSQGLRRNHPSTEIYASGVSQSFRILTGNYNLTKAAFEIKKIGSPTVDLIVNLYLSASNKPTGSPLSTAASVNSSTLPTSYQWINFTFPSTYIMNNNTWYCIEIQTSETGLADLSNSADLYVHSGNPIEGSEALFCFSQWNLQSQDVDFRIFGQQEGEMFDVTFCKNDAGTFLVNSTSKSNGTMESFWSGDVLNLSAVPDALFLFQVFTWDGGSSYSNPCYLTVSSNMTVWVHFIGVDDWLAGSVYRKSHVVNSAAGADVDYPIQITAHYGSGSDSGSNVYLLGHSQADFDDVRFTAYDGSSLLSYWLESKVDGDYANFWVKISGNLTAANQLIYVYYGNSTISSASDGDATFGFFEDFLGSSLNSSKWTADADGNFDWSIHDSKIDVSNSKYDSLGSRWGFWHTGFPYGTSFKITVKDLYVYCGDNPDDPMFEWGIVLCNTSSPWDAEISAYLGDFWVGDYPANCSRVGESTYASGSNGAASTSQIMIIKAGDNATVYWNGVKVLSANTSITLEQILIEASCEEVPFQIYPYPWHTTIDRIIVQRFVDPEPSHGSWGIEEKDLPWVTFYMNDAGTLSVNGTGKTNGTESQYDLYSIMTLTASPSAHYHFLNFSWSIYSSSSNPSNILAPETNLTIWTYFIPDPYVTFYKIKDSLTFSVNGTSKANGTQIQFELFTVLNLLGSGWTKYYGFSNWTFSYGGSSESNPYSLLIPTDQNFSIWLFDKWDPSIYPPDFPSTPAAIQYLIQGDYLGFINSVMTSQIGELFYALIMVFCYVGLYLRLKSIAIPLIAWTLMGGLWIGMAPSVSPFVALFWIIGIGGSILYGVFGRGSEN